MHDAIHGLHDFVKRALETLLAKLEKKGTPTKLLFKGIQNKVLQKFSSQFSSLYQTLLAMQDAVEQAIPYTELTPAFFEDIKKQLAKNTPTPSPTLFSASPPKNRDPSPDPSPFPTKNR